MNRIEGITRIYSQAPWRKQSQIVGLILVVVVFSTLFATVYLHISARTAEVGRQIQVMQNEIDEIDRMNEDLRSQLALIKSSDQMEQRAEALGFQPVQMDEITFLSVQGFMEPPVMVYQHRPVDASPGIAKLPDEYTESLFDWMRRKTAFYLVVR
ncbi:MAG: hypothetical protein A2Z16_00255 [Chloroflexi bacterium RBG_16_54_18]|nr:MAG: hypothetical protein A2Z16_00255 [Chloroflexi bacterium RBG_16_54_18]